MHFIRTFGQLTHGAPNPPCCCRISFLMKNFSRNFVVQLSPNDKCQGLRRSKKVYIDVRVSRIDRRHQRALRSATTGGRLVVTFGATRLASRDDDLESLSSPSSNRLSSCSLRDVVRQGESITLHSERNPLSVQVAMLKKRRTLPLGPLMPLLLLLLMLLLLLLLLARATVLAIDVSYLRTIRFQLRRQLSVDCKASAKLISVSDSSELTSTYVRMKPPYGINTRDTQARSLLEHVLPLTVISRL
jgi:hypothetical protein